MVNNVYVSAVTTDNISRHAVLAWVNDTIQANLSKVEEMSTGAAYCQLTHRLFPEYINLKKVKWQCRSDIDAGVNWKLLVTSWKDIGIEKPVQFDRLIKAKFQDNFEFLQWFYKFYNANSDGCDEYDAIGARGGEPLPAGGKGPAARPGVRAAAPPRAAVAPVRKAPTAAAAAPATRSAPLSARSNGNGVAKAQSPDPKHAEELAAARNQAAEWEESAMTFEKERDFYFERLRIIEDMCNATTEPIAPSAILAVLYKNEDDADAELEVGDVVEEEHAATVEAGAHEDLELDDSETF